MYQITTTADPETDTTEITTEAVTVGDTFPQSKEYTSARIKLKMNSTSYLSVPSTYMISTVMYYCMNYCKLSCMKKFVIEAFKICISLVWMSSLIVNPPLNISMEVTHVTPIRTQFYYQTMMKCVVLS